MIKLKPITAEDTPFIIKSRNDKDIKRYFVIQDDYTTESQQNWLDNVIAKGKAIQYIVLFEEQPVGSVYIRDIDYVNKKGEFGIFIGSNAHRGQGIGVSATKEIVRIAFEELKLHRVYLRVFPENVSAIRSYEKAGFRYEGLLRNTVCVNGEYKDMIVMAVLNTESSR
jgi:diamine N-acetyltransferase